LLRGSFRERTESAEQGGIEFPWLASRHVFEIPVNSSDEEFYEVMRAARRHYPDDHEAAMHQDKVSFYVQDLGVSLVFPTRYYCFTKTGDTRLLFLTAGTLRQIDFSFIGEEQMEAARQTIRMNPVSARDQHFHFIENVEKIEQSELSIEEKRAEIEKLSSNVTQLQMSIQHQERRNAGETIEKRKSVSELAVELNLAPNTLSGYITQIRKADAALPASQQRIKTPPREPYNYQAEYEIRKFVGAKQKRPSRRKSRIVAKSR
jgi:DNA-binding CsgD family transcriptional regulator